ncbi:MAG: hypothetical protein EON88_06015 [Brevundimonas sp.]|nr:MAG: hypothetical protein EON88_06015 [Brevundimonas sp.]
MSDWLNAFNPTAPIHGEAEAQCAARASAVSIFIGVAVGLVSLVWSLANPADIQAAVDQASGNDATVAAAAEMGVQMGLWMGGVLTVVQLVFGVVQWRDPKSFIAILFLVLLGLGIVSALAAPMMGGMSGVITPIWQVILSLAIMAVQTVLHVAGLRGIKALDRIQMAAAH